MHRTLARNLIAVVLVIVILASAAYATATYPGGIKSFVFKNTGDIIQASDANQAYDEVRELERGNRMESRDRTFLIVIAVGLVLNLALTVGLALRPNQVVTLQSIINQLGQSEARAQLWEARAHDLEKQIQQLIEAQRQRPTPPAPGK